MAHALAESCVSEASLDQWLEPLRAVCALMAVSIVREPQGVPIAWKIEAQSHARAQLKAAVPRGSGAAACLVHAARCARARYSALCISISRLAVRWNSNLSFSPLYSSAGAAAADRITLTPRS